MKIAKKISTVLCDDVREEKKNKFSLMGIYPKDIIFGKFPALLPKICLAILLGDVQSDFRSCNVTLKLPALEPSVLNLKVEENSIGSSVSIFAVIVPFRVKEPGEAKFEVRFGDNKRPSIIHRFELQEAKKNK